MKVLFIGILPPPGGDAAYRFGQAAALRAMSGDVVVTHAPNPLSVAHKNLRLGARTLLRHIRSEAKNFDAVVLRVGTDLSLGGVSGLLRKRRRVGACARSLGGYSHVSVFVDPGAAGVDQIFQAWLRPLWDVSTEITVANELDRTAFVGRGGVASEKVVLSSATSAHAKVIASWPSADSTSLAPKAAAAIRQRAHAKSTDELLLASAPGHARPSVRGGSVWLVRRVIGKTRGWVTKLLRP